MTRRTANRFQRFMVRSAGAVAVLAYGSAWSMDGAEAGLNGWLIGVGMIAVLALGLYLQSIRRRVA